jgi:hypothetical protein
MLCRGIGHEPKTQNPTSRQIHLQMYCFFSLQP